MLNKKIIIVPILIVLVLTSIQSQAQYTWIPKIRLNSTTTDPQIDLTRLNGLTGIDIGLELQGKGNIYFNPGIFYSEFNVDLINIDTTTTINNETNIGSAKHRILKVPFNLGVYLTDKNNNVALRILFGLQPVFRIGRADYKNADLEDIKIQRNVSIYGIFGVGLDIGNLVIDIGYEINHVRLFERSDQATNFLTIGVGYRI